MICVTVNVLRLR